jgi:hypothetical protein
MYYAFNKIKFNRKIANFIGKEGKKRVSKNHIRSFSHQMPGPDKDPFPSWKFIAFISGVGLYHQYVNQIKKD